jgi:hypothetical protein
MPARKTSTKPQINIHQGSSFDDFLEDERIRNEAETAAIKKVLAWQFQAAMVKQKKTKQGMASELRTSRSQLDRLLDPDNTAVTLETLSRAASVLGKHLVIEIKDRPAVRKVPALKLARHA